MKAVTVVPGEPEKVAVSDVNEPADADGSILVQGRLLGVCGTDADIVNHQGYGWPPPGEDRLLIGHESLGEVLEAPPGSDFAAGDLVAGIVRRPDPVPCRPCADGQWDFCRNGKYTERGIKQRSGYGSQRWRIEPDYAVKIDPQLGDRGVLIEPASVLAKAWEQTDLMLTRTSLRPGVALITGAGPVGLFAALLAVQRGLEVHVLDLNDSGPKVGLVEDLGAYFHTGDVDQIGVQPDVVMECTGNGPLTISLADVVSPDAVICLLGFASDEQTTPAALDRFVKQTVLKNTVVFGSVNADRGNYQQAADALAKADQNWLHRMITRRVSMEGFADALTKGAEDVKVVVDLTGQEA